MDAQSLATYLSRYQFREITDDKGNPTGAVVTCPVRLAFCHLAKPREKINPRTGEKTAAYAAVLIIPPAADVTVLRTVAAREAQSKFGANWKALDLRNPLRPQAKNAGKYDGFSTDGFYLDTESRFVVPIVGSRKGPDGKFPPLDPASELVYSGMWAICNLNAYSYDASGNRGVKFGLRAIQKLADDDEFKGSDAASAFGEIDHSGVVAHGGNAGVKAAVAAKAPALADSDW